MKPAPVRCTAPHPRVPGWLCGYRLLDALPGTIELSGGSPPPGCVWVLCKRCGTKHVICAKAEKA